MNSAQADYSNKWYADQFTAEFLKDSARYCEKWATWLVWDDKNAGKRTANTLYSPISILGLANWAKVAIKPKITSRGKRTQNN